MKLKWLVKQGKGAALQDGSEVDCEVYVWKEVSSLRAATIAPFTVQ